MGVYSSLQESIRNEVLAVGTSSVKVSESRNDVNPRITILARNTSPNATDIIYINLGLSTATTGSGIVLRQYESYTDTTGEGYVAFQGVITAICATATGQLTIMER